MNTENKKLIEDVRNLLNQNKIVDPVLIKQLLSLIEQNEKPIPTNLKGIPAIEQSKLVEMYKKKVASKDGKK